MGRSELQVVMERMHEGLAKLAESRRSGDDLAPSREELALYRRSGEQLALAAPNSCVTREDELLLLRRELEVLKESERRNADLVQWASQIVQAQHPCRSDDLRPSQGQAQQGDAAALMKVAGIATLRGWRVETAEKVLREKALAEVASRHWATSQKQACWGLWDEVAAEVKYMGLTMCVGLKLWRHNRLSVAVCLWRCAVLAPNRGCAFDARSHMAPDKDLVTRDLIVKPHSSSSPVGLTTSGCWSPAFSPITPMTVVKTRSSIRPTKKPSGRKIALQPDHAPPLGGPLAL